MRDTLSGSETDLVVMYGSDDDLMGRSLLRRVASKTVKGAKSIAKSPGRIAAVALAPATGGASLLAMKNVRKPVARVAAKTARATGGGVATAARTVARSRLAKNVASTGLKAGLAYATGGASLAPAALARVANLRAGLAKKAAPLAPAASAFSLPNVNITTGPGGIDVSASKPEAEPASAGFKMPPMTAVLALGGAALLLFAVAKK